MQKNTSLIISIIMFLLSLPVYADNDTATKEIFYPNDPLLERQWYYEAVRGYAFRNNGITGQGVKVGIIDTGLTKEFKTFHDFEGVNIQPGINVAALIEQERPGHEEENRVELTEDSGHHGTAVTSIICAKSDNEHGIAGLTDGCLVIPYKIHDFYYADDNEWLKGAALMKSIELAYQNNCDVVNISQGDSTTAVSAELNRIVDSCIQNGMIIIAATGNDGRTTNSISYPAACDNVIGVGSVEPTCDDVSAAIDAITEAIKPKNEATAGDGAFRGWLRSTVQNLPGTEYKKTETSTANESVFVCAPGSGITAADTLDVSSWTDKISNFSENSGTSFATPIVASVAIGVKQMRPYVDIDIFKEILKATVVDLEDEGYDINTGYGMVNFERIYEYVSKMPLTAPERTPEVTVDYDNGQLVGFPINREYTVNGEAVTLNDDFSLPIKEEWYGTTIEIVKKASSESYEDSLPQMLDIPEKAAPPTIGELTIDYANERLYGLESDKEYTVNGKDVSLTTFVYPTTGTGFEIADDWFGTTITVAIKDTDTSKDIAIPARPEVTGLSGDKSMIIGTTANMQYRKQGSTTWRNCSDGSTRVSFSSGTAEVYIKATDVAFKSDIVTVEVGAAATPTPEVTSKPTATPTSEPTIEPTETPEISFLPTIDYKNGRIIGLDSTKEYTVNGEDITICTYPTGETGFDIDELWYGETIILAVKGTDEVRQITVQFAEQEQYELETNIEYNPETGECVYSAVNNTIWTINATGMVAVYGSNGVLKHLETIDTFHADGVNEKLNFTLTDGDTVKWFIWDSRQSMQPKDKVRSSAYVVEFDETE